MISTLKPSLKGILGQTLWHFPTRLAFKLAVRRAQGLVLMFHYVGPPVLPGVAEDLFLSKTEFAKILDFVVSELSPLAPLDFMESLVAGKLPTGATMLTFDDGTRDHLTEVLPELVRRKLEACFFVCPGLIQDGRSIPALELMSLCSQVAAGNYELEFNSQGVLTPLHLSTRIEISEHTSRVDAYRLLIAHLLSCSSRQQPIFLNYLQRQFGINGNLKCIYPLATWDELKLLEEAGMLIGNHTMYHSTITADGTDQFAADCAQAFLELEARFSIPRRLFCYPYGRKVDVTAATTSTLRSQQVDFAFVTQGGLARPLKFDVWNLHREQAAYSAAAIKLAPLFAIFR